MKGIVQVGPDEDWEAGKQGEGLGKEKLHEFVNKLKAVIEAREKDGVR